MRSKQIRTNNISLSCLLQSLGCRHETPGLCILGNYSTFSKEFYVVWWKHTCICCQSPQRRACDSILQFDFLILVLLVLKLQCSYYFLHECLKDGHIRNREQHLQFSDISSHQNDYQVCPNTHFTSLHQRMGIKLKSTTFQVKF